MCTTASISLIRIVAPQSGHSLASGMIFVLVDERGFLEANIPAAP
jgi:hypothetical protein